MMKILILEDNKDRRTAMHECIRDRFYQYEAVFFDDAQDMLRHLETDLSTALIISLDHDLELKNSPDGKSIDTGTGRDVAEFLARQAPCCPVIIATTNSAAGDGMEYTLRDAHWVTHRVFPYGDLEWISGPWFRTLRNAIVGAVKQNAVEAL